MEIEEILKTEFSIDFVEKMQRAMVVSYYKYGAIAVGFPTKIDAVGSLMIRLRKYADTGNTEYLVDVANFAMIEFLHPRHPEAHYKAESSEASPGRISLDDPAETQLDNAGNDLSKGRTSNSHIGNMREFLNRTGFGGDDK